MGLSSFPSPADGMLQVLVMNTIFSMSLFKNMVSYVLHFVIGVSDMENSSNLDDDYHYYSSLSNDVGLIPTRGLLNSHSSIIPTNEALDMNMSPQARRRISTTRYESLCRSRTYEDQEQESGSKNGENNNNNNNNKWSLMECCVCLNRFEGDEEVSELSCKHFFHKGCLEKWFHKQHTTCPLCRSIL